MCILARLLDKDTVHQGSLLMSRCQHGDKECFSYRCDYGFLYWRNHLVGAHFPAIYATQQKCKDYYRLNFVQEAADNATRA